MIRVASLCMAVAILTYPSEAIVSGRTNAPGPGSAPAAASLSARASIGATASKKAEVPEEKEAQSEASHVHNSIYSPGFGHSLDGNVGFYSSGGHSYGDSGYAGSLYGSEISSEHFGSEHFGSEHFGSEHFGSGHDDFGHHHPVHISDPHHHKAIAFKSLLVPLAGVALLGAAAAFVTNPILLQLGVISGGRRRRAVDSNIRQRLGEIHLLEQFMAQIPHEEARIQEKRLMASYLTCTGITGTATNSSSPSSATCLERMCCELAHPASRASTLEKHVVKVVSNEILSNEYVPEVVKKRVRKAVDLGASSGRCNIYFCADMDKK